MCYSANWLMKEVPFCSKWSGFTIGFDARIHHTAALLPEFVIVCHSDIPVCDLVQVDCLLHCVTFHLPPFWKLILWQPKCLSCIIGKGTFNCAQLVSQMNIFQRYPVHFFALFLSLPEFFMQKWPKRSGFPSKSLQIVMPCTADDSLNLQWFWMTPADLC